MKRLALLTFPIVLVATCRAGTFSATCTPLAGQVVYQSGDWQAFATVHPTNVARGVGYLNCIGTALSVGSYRPAFRWSVRYSPSNTADVISSALMTLQLTKAQYIDEGHYVPSYTKFEHSDSYVSNQQWVMSEQSYPDLFGYASEWQSTTYSYYGTNTYAVQVSVPFQQVGTGPTRYYSATFAPSPTVWFSTMKITDQQYYGFPANAWCTTEYALKVNNVVL